MEISAEQETKQISMKPPHVVLLGAGASRAALPEGERSGKRLPLMADFVETVPVKDLLREVPELPIGLNFEGIYSKISQDPTRRDLCRRLEGVIHDYFDSLELPSTPTIYDHLLLSLRSKDFIATFNWDPFLIQAANRNRKLKRRLPTILFLHGNVLAGYCERDDVYGIKGNICSKCRNPFQPSRLLYPVADKDYRHDPMIARSWKALDEVLGYAFMVTIFGYSAPVSDVGAMALLRSAWGRWEERQFEQFEIIDVQDEGELRKNWQDFIHTHHYEVHDDFYDSWIALHPRRTGEAYRNQYMEAKFIEANPLPKSASFPELWEWFMPLLEAEEAEAET
jgi:hypothetical protein